MESKCLGGQERENKGEEGGRRESKSERKEVEESKGKKTREEAEAVARFWASPHMKLEARQSGHTVTLRPLWASVALSCMDSGVT